jgi:hypothetical protein
LFFYPECFPLLRMRMRRLRLWIGSNHGASIIKLEPLD